MQLWSLDLGMGHEEDTMRMHLGKSRSQGDSTRGEREGGVDHTCTPQKRLNLPHPHAHTHARTCDTAGSRPVRWNYLGSMCRRLWPEKEEAGKMER